MGQAEIIGALLLVVIATLMWLGFWSWFYPQMQIYQQRIEIEESTVRRSLGEYVLVEILYRNAAGRICAYITNTGDYETNIVSLYFNDTLVWNGKIPLKVGESIEIETPLTSGGTYRVKVCTLYNCFEVIDYVP